MPTSPKATIAVIGGKKKIKKISDLTIEQLGVLIDEIVEQRLEEYLGDPDEGLKLRPEFVRKLKRSMTHPPKKRYTLQEIAARCGIKLEE
ncbi:MAG TPA: hypothetical protein VGA85_01335 [Dehalococcoidales bacterium]